jgi:hypothetical protein
MMNELLAAIESELSIFTEVRNLLAGGSGLTHRTVKGTRKRPIMSAEAREKIAAAQRRRWAKQKKVEK